MEMLFSLLGNLKNNVPPITEWKIIDSNIGKSFLLQSLYYSRIHVNDEYFPIIRIRNGIGKYF